MELNYTNLIVAGGLILSGALIMLVGIIVGSRIVFRVAGGADGLLIDQNHPEIVQEGDDDEEETEYVTDNDLE